MGKSGELIVLLCEDFAPAEVDGGVLFRRARLLAAAAVLAHHWPDQGSWHQAALGVAGLSRSRLPRLPGPAADGRPLAPASAAGPQAARADTMQVGPVRPRARLRFSSAGCAKQRRLFYGGNGES